MGSIVYYFKKKSLLALLALFLIGMGVYLTDFQTKEKAIDPASKKWTDNNLVVLLTMTINTKSTGPRSKLEDRINDYRKSVTQWAKLPYKVVIVDNSGYPNPFKDILKNTKNIQYVSTYIPYQAKRGIGYGEAQTLKYAIEKVITNDSIYIMKVTGRYAPAESLSDVVNILMSKKPNAILKEMPSNIEHPKRSEWFVAKRPFYEELVSNCMETCDDSKGWDYAIETHLHHLGDVTQNVIKTHLNIDVIRTRDGSYNKKILQI